MAKQTPDAKAKATADVAGVESRQVAAGKKEAVGQGGGGAGAGARVKLSEVK